MFRFFHHLKTRTYTPYRTLRLLGPFFDPFVYCRLRLGPGATEEGPRRLRRPIVMDDWNDHANIEDGWAGSDLEAVLSGTGSMPPTTTVVSVTDRFKACLGAKTSAFATIQDRYLSPLVIIGHGLAGGERAVPIGMSVPGFASVCGRIDGGDVEPTIRAGIATVDRTGAGGTSRDRPPYRSVIWAPVGSYGVLIGQSPEPSAFDRDDLARAAAIGASFARLAADDADDMFADTTHTPPVRNRIVGLLSHNLGNEIAIAKARLELAAETGETDHLENATHAVEAIERTVQEVISVARSGELITSMDVIDLRTTAETVFRRVDPSGASLHVETSARIVADPTCVEILLDTVFRNAVADSSAPVRIEVGSLADGFYVADTGPGIQKDDYPVGDTTPAASSGSGMTLVDRVAAAHDWSVRIVELETGGTRVEVRGVDQP